MVVTLPRVLLLLDFWPLLSNAISPAIVKGEPGSAEQSLKFLMLGKSCRFSR